MELSSSVLSAIKENALVTFRTDSRYDGSVKNAETGTRTATGLYRCTSALRPQDKFRLGCRATVARVILFADSLWWWNTYAEGRIHYATV